MARARRHHAPNARAAWARLRHEAANAARQEAADGVRLVAAAELDALTLRALLGDPTARGTIAILGEWALAVAQGGRLPACSVCDRAEDEPAAGWRIEPGRVRCICQRCWTGRTVRPVQ